VSGSGGSTPAIDWAALHDAAVAVAQHAYVPYSRFPVGAAALTDDGRVVVGCNVENASYGLTICAEVNLAGHLAVSGGGRLVAVATVTGDGVPVTPCGRCRQVLTEFGSPDTLVNGDGTPRRLADLLPGAFTRGELETRRAAMDAAAGGDDA
jgi:cytidine deaminase